MHGINYKTTRSIIIRNKILRNAFISALATASFCWLWKDEGGIYNAAGAIVSALFLLIVLLTLIKSKNPLQITAGNVIISSLFSISIPLGQIEKIGLHPKRKTPSLSYTEPKTGIKRELALPWTFIAEPQAEVLEKIQLAIDSSNNGR